MGILWRTILPLFAYFITQTIAQAQQKTPFDYVDPLIGTTNGGHVFPGATLPFGMAKAGPDVIGENQGGFASDNSPIYGFSHMHDSGTGGSPSLGNFPIFPFTSCDNNNINNCRFSKYSRATRRVPGSVKAHPGYFAITLESQIQTEMTVTNHTAFYRFTFPEKPVEANSTLRPVVIVDLDDLPNTRSDGNIQVNAQTGRITGNAVFSPSFGSGNYRSYFCADFAGANFTNLGIYSGSRARSDLSVNVKGRYNANPAGGWIQFNAPASKEIVVRVGMSFISEVQACSNAEKEIPQGDFLSIRLRAEQVWRDKLSVIEVKPGGASEDLMTSFWSGVYRSMISPQDYTGENPLWTSDEPYYDSFYCIWDSFRSIHPLLTLLDPHSQTLMVRSLIDIYRHEGKLPDCRMSLCKGFTQGGSNADVVLVDAYLKNLTTGIDWRTGYLALISDAEIEPPNWDLEGRGGLDSWKRTGYIPLDDDDDPNTGTHTRSISRTVEYAYNDFCIAQMAKGIGNMGDYTKYLQRSGNWRNLYKPNQTSSIYAQDTGFVGFLQPRYKNGTWGYQDPIFCSPLLEFTSCYLNPEGHETYEGSAWLYTFFVPGDMETLIRTLGGRDSFVKRLDFFHESGLLYIGDEQGFLKVFLYHYAGRPGLSALRTHFYIPSQFNSTVSGIPGNDDSGAMGSFQALTMMGIFPNAGQDVYFITPPFFEEVSILNQQTGRKATIRNVNFDPTGKNVFIQSARLNGKEYNKNWLTHSFFMGGGVLELVLGSSESKWGTRTEDVPPSLGPFGDRKVRRRM
ncbi:alpha-1,2-mannosidase-like protein [Delitschia confertaspora ATCC 74209]|uniref:Alpha-1,2-mannosidase-like protein n=1 Tax=Delitschia confertaspora ATCC 74209 TaxID=1513339 RepID=A0A9P4JT39_9PLEO|nr:alpha-1,2-mannosidase-like protein [Delitschia confertaspora ATCC 74209]